MGVSFDLFGTLVAVERPADPAAAVARELTARSVAVPDDWAEAYTESHVDIPEGAELSLPDHVNAALASRGVTVDYDTVEQAVIAAFDPVVDTRDGASVAIEAANRHGPVALCSNCSVPTLVDRTIRRSALERDAFDAIVSSNQCGWRKPAPEIFEQTAAALGCSVAALLHIGDDPRTDGGIEALGGQFHSLTDQPLTAVPATLEAIDP